MKVESSLNFYYCFITQLLNWHLDQCFSTAGPRPGTGPWHQLYRAAREILLELITNLNVPYYSIDNARVICTKKV